jgi:hypothetical protein
MNDDSKDAGNIRGFPVVYEYKYLRMAINPTMSPDNRINAINRKIKDYLGRNAYLHRKYFTPTTLLRLVDYIVKSRLSYGLCCFIDNHSAMVTLENALSKHMKSIFGLPRETSHRRLRLTLGEPDLKVRLACRLIKYWHRYKEHFGDYPG